ncbi:MAG TPA: lysophospholipid acyltransferase family protein [Polyangiaceae bacterium]
MTSLHVEGEERLETASPVVVMANHESLFDPAVIMRTSRKPLRFVVKKDVSRVPVFGKALAAMGHVFVDRGDSGEADPARPAYGALTEAAGAIAAGRSVLVFPEGTRSETDALLPFRTGGFRLAVRAGPRPATSRACAGSPILPVGIGGTRHLAEARRFPGTRRSRAGRWRSRAHPRPRCA